MQKELLNKGEGVYEIDATLEKEAWTAAREKALKKLILTKYLHIEDK